METLLKEILIHFECHDIKGISSCFASGLSPNYIHDGKPLMYTLIAEYKRSDKFKECIAAFVDAGLVWEDNALLAVLLNDARRLEIEISNNRKIIDKHYFLKAAYTPFYGVSLLHICAEFNHTECAKILIKNGASVNILALTDENGFGGQTPIFHTVNQNNHQSEAMLQLLLQHKAKLLITVKGIIWGNGYEWETFIPSVNVISYCMMGLLPQMHRNEYTIANTITLLLKAAYGIDYIPKNVPCKYLLH